MAPTLDQKIIHFLNRLDYERWKNRKAFTHLNHLDVEADHFLKKSLRTFPPSQSRSPQEAARVAAFLVFLEGRRFCGNVKDDPYLSCKFPPRFQSWVVQYECDEYGGNHIFCGVGRTPQDAAHLTIFRVFVDSLTLQQIKYLVELSGAPDRFGFPDAFDVLKNKEV